MIAPAGFLVGLVSVGEGGRDQSPDFSRDAAGEFDGQQDVHVHRHMVAVLLHGAYGEEDRNRAIADTAIIFRPWQFDGEDGIRSEERRVGKEWVSTCRSRGAPCQ